MCGVGVMNKPMFDLNGDKFQYREIGTEKPVCTIYAKSEKKAYKQLIGFLEKIGKLSLLDEMELIK